MRCLEKLFLPFEIKLIQKSSKPLQTFWILWSIKESAYKAWQRESKSEPIFNPIAFQIIKFIREGNQAYSKVEINKLSFQIISEITSDYIYSYADSNLILNEIYTKDNSKFLDRLAKQDWILKKLKYNVPILFNPLTKENRPISLSHDGRFYAISFSKD